MDHFAGLDVSVKETSVCIVDDSGKIIREVKVASEPEATERLHCREMTLRAHQPTHSRRCD
jgi:predicted NBD/HSP70 family sugar kinase